MSEQLNRKIHIVLTTIFSFLIPLFPNILPLLILLLGLNWLLYPKNIPSSFSTIGKNKSLLALVVLYVLYLLGLTYSENYKFASEILETKFSFLILPLIFSAYIKETKQNFNSYLKMFVFGCIAYAIFCFSYATYAFFKPVYTDLYGVLYDLGANYFYYSYLSFLFHPSYTSMYTIVALISILYLHKQQAIFVNWKWLLAILFLSVYILLLSSKAGWIGLVIFYLIFIVQFINKPKLLYVIGSIGIVSALFFIFNVYYTPEFSNRIPKMETITNAINEKDGSNNLVTTGSEGTGSRIFVWKASLEIIKDNLLLGVGTGDSKYKMLEKYLSKGMETEYKFGLNSHNQYLNTAVSIGIVGLFILILCFFIPFYQGFKLKELLLFGFVIIVGLNLLFESMFERQSGVIFYAFFHTILSLTFLQKNKIHL